MNTGYSTIISDKIVSYSEFVDNLAKKLPTKNDDLIHAALGIAGESGEIVDAIKKAVIYNKPLDRENIIEELGDINWYITLLQGILEITDEEIMHHNTEKLKVRYNSGKYSDKAAQDRADKQGE